MNSYLFGLNTHGVFLFIASVLIYEYFVVRERELFYHSIFSIISALIITVILKELFTIPRPFLVEGMSPGAGLTHLSSFPSTHTALAFALASTVTLHQKKFGVLVFILATAVAIGRVVAAVHYPMDIFAGVLIGVLCGLFFDTIHFGKKRARRR